MPDFVEITSGDKWFKENPDKIAGVEFETTSMFFPIQVKGTKEDVLRVTGFSEKEPSGDSKRIALAKAKAKLVMVQMSMDNEF